MKLLFFRINFKNISEQDDIFKNIEMKKNY